MSTAPAIGTCFGFAVRSPLSLHYLRRGADGDPLEVVIAPHRATQGERLVREWTLDGPEPFHARLSEDNGRYHFWMEESGSFRVDPQKRSISVPRNGNAVKREERLWGIPALLCFRARGDLPLHAAAVETDDGALLLAAPRTFGKTTLAAGFVRAGYRLLSEDLSCIRLGLAPAVVPGPAMLRLRPDIAPILDLPEAWQLEAGDERVHIALPEDRRGDCRPVPVRGIAFLRGGVDDFSLRRVDTAEAIRDLYALSFRLPEDDDLARCFTGVAELAASTPVWEVGFPHGLSALDDTVQRIIADV